MSENTMLSPDLVTADVSAGAPAGGGSTAPVRDDEWSRVKRGRFYIGGAWIDAADAATFDVIDPADETLLARVPQADATHIHDAVTAARHAFDHGSWATLHPTGWARYRYAGSETGSKATSRKASWKAPSWSPAGIARPICHAASIAAPRSVANVDNQSTIAREEIFGPVVSVIPASDEMEAIKLANDSDFGLNAAVFTNDPDRAFSAARQLRSGTVGVNAFRSDFGIAFGGFKQSGIGREGGREGLLPYLETKTIVMDEWPSNYVF